MPAIVTTEARNGILTDGLGGGQLFDVIVISNSLVLDANTVYADLVQSVEAGYAPITGVTFTVANAIATTPDQVFTAGTGGWSNFTGYAVVTQGGSPEIRNLVQKDTPATPYTLNDGDPYTCDIQVDLNAGA